MKKITLTIAACAGLLAAAPLYAAIGPTLNDLLGTCTGDNQVCRAHVGDYINSASMNRFICIPDGVTHEQAVDRLLAWLRDAADKPAVAAGSADDAEWDGVNALFPCKNK